MIRVKTKNKSNKNQVNEIVKKEIEKMRAKLKDECYQELMHMVIPTIMLAVKDELKPSDIKMEKLNDRIERYFLFIANQQISIDDVRNNLKIEG